MPADPGPAKIAAVIGGLVAVVTLVLCIAAVCAMPADDTKSSKEETAMPVAKPPKFWWYPEGTPPLVKNMTVGGGLVALVTLVLCLVAVWKKGVLPLLYVLAAVWAIGPPLWFWYEYHGILVGRTDFDSDKFDGYKYGVDLGSKVWAAVYAFLALYLASEYLKQRQAATITPPTPGKEPAGAEKVTVGAPRPAEAGRNRPRRRR